MLSGEAPLTLRGDRTLASENPAKMRRCLEEINEAHAKDPTPSRGAFEPGKFVPNTTALTARQNGLLAALKAKRLEIARNQKQPAFAIFHDSVLIEMALRCPRTSEELMKIPGVGPKAARHGAIFLSAIADYNRE